MQFELIGAPLELGCGTCGTSGAWEALRRPLSERISAAGNTLTQQTIPVDNTRRTGAQDGMNNAPEVLSVCRALAETVAQACAAGSFPLVVGGDHSIGYGTIAGLSESLSPQALSVIWVDAHTDINTETGSVSHNIHGMPLAAALGLCGDALSGIGRGRVKLLPENLYIIGAHSIDPPEAEICEQLGVHLYKMDELRRRGIDAVLREVVASVDTAAVHLSFDVDALDAADFTATGIALSGGYRPREAADVLETLIAALPVVSFDCVEYNPDFDPDGSGKRTVLDIMARVLDALMRKKA